MLVTIDQLSTLLESATLIHRGRNTLWRVEVEGNPLCIKQYGFASPLKRWVYRYLRPSKAQRAWRNSLRLRQAGFDSPEPVAIIETHTLWGIEKSYYICRYIEGITLYRWGDAALNDIRPQLTLFAEFTALLHNKGLMLSDFTPGNILFSHGHFTLVDTNRMYVGKVSIKRGLQNMAGLWLQPEAAAQLAQDYVLARGEKDAEHYIRDFMRFRRSFWLHFAKRHHLHDVIIHHDVDGTQFTYHFNSTIR